MLWSISSQTTFHPLTNNVTPQTLHHFRYGAEHILQPRIYRSTYETILHFYGDFESGINWKIQPRMPSLFLHFYRGKTTQGLTLDIMWNFITEHFIALKCASVAELFNSKSSFTIELEETSGLSASIKN